MSAGPFSPHQASPSELKARIDAERRHAPFLVFRAADDEQRIFALEGNGGRLRVGRDPMCEVCLDHDDQVSRLHAELENVGDVWALVDFGLSRNGSFVNEELVATCSTVWPCCSSSRHAMRRRCVHDGQLRPSSAQREQRASSAVRSDRRGAETVAICVSSCPAWRGGARR
jgi:hypothetical protein